ncbi:MAG: hypothetical protein NTZ84_01980 [Candidatus Nealsonbacteria bacterium]|nr:hypothetical protein [Candidatus Nealsonbacteria bacterium]
MLEFEMTRERVPCLYELSFKKGNPPVLVLRIHNDFLEANKGCSPTQTMLGYMREEHNLGEFLPFGGEYFGFDEALKKVKTEDQFTEFNIEIPVYRKETAEKCNYCKGEGWDKDLQLSCSWCDGTKHKILYDWKPFIAISASLELLTSLTEIFNKKTSEKKYQLMSIRTTCGKKSGRFPIGGSYGIDFCNWLATFPEGHQFSRVVQTMAEVHAHIYSQEIDFYDFEAYVGSNDWLVIGCPGDACGIHRSDEFWEPGEGKVFSCHNLDNAIQQIELLIGLAVMSDEARKEI